jgi:hypothetical protein
MKPSRWIILVTLAVLVVAVGCGKPPEPGTEKCLKNCDRPGWVNEPDKESTKELKAFAGISHRFSTESDARRDARLEAYKEAVQSMGVYGKMKINQVISSIGGSVDILTPGVVTDEMTKLEAKGPAVGEVKEYNTEYWQKTSEIGPEYFYVTNALFLMPRDAVKEFMKGVLAAEKAQQRDEAVKRNIDRALEKMEELEAIDW